MNIMQRRNPTPLEMVVARAAPAEPILGAPRRPKIRMAFMFRNTITTLAIVHSLTNPTFLRSVSKTDANVMKTYENDAILMYGIPLVMSSGSFVNTLITPSGMNMPQQKNTITTGSDNASM